jgi:hypothetical protein
MVRLIRIVTAFKLERIILFDSYTNSTPQADSSVDLLIVIPLEGQYPFVHKIRDQGFYSIYNP